MKPHILVVGAQHGDERLGPRVQRFLRADTSGKYATVDYLCGNPRAFRRNTRFTETDLNRSYGVNKPESYEERRAHSILRKIRYKNYDFVLDIHTSRANVGKFVLAAHLSRSVRKIISASPYNRVAVMPSDIADCSLIGNVPNAISIEYDRKLTYQQQSLLDIVRLLESLLEQRYQPQLREVFYVSERIPLDCPVSYSSKNFKLCPQGFYPVIFAENSSYTTYKGFAAYRREQKKI